MTTKKTTITVKTTVGAPVEQVWELWTTPRHIIRWNYASDDWHTPYAENDLRPGGRFLSRMAAKNGSAQFDFTGTYQAVDPYRLISYLIDDGRPVQLSFVAKGEETEITETFEAEQMHPAEIQQAGWQAILDNFKKYAEADGRPALLHFETTIGANAATVFHALFDEKMYNEWTTVFNPTSHFKGSWKKGSKMIFLGTGQDGKEGGMISRIREKIPNRFVSIEHVGIIEDGKEISSGPDVERWAGALENYTLTENNEGTLLSVDMDAFPEWAAYFSETWPRALEKLKTICER